MNKKNILIIVITYTIFIILFVIFLFQRYQTYHAPFRCAGDIITSRNYNGKVYTLNATISIVNFADNHGSIRMKGFIEDPDNQQSILDRTMNFVMINKNKDIFTTEIEYQEKPIIDTTDDEIFELFSLKSNHLRMNSKIHDNVILFHDIVSPQLLCIAY